MAHIFPNSKQTKVIFSSTAEERFYQSCESLGANWRIYYSCTLSQMEDEKGLRDNEIDFVCYHPRFGIIVVEVKGGRISKDAQGNFFSINRHGESFSIKDPFEQALIWKSRFLRFLRKNRVRVPVSYAVCFPSVTESDVPVSASITSEIIIGRKKMQCLEETLKDIAIKSQPADYLKFKDISRDLDRLLIGKSFTTRLYLRDYLDNHDNRVKDIESIHETLITPISSSPRLGVEGEAGTGKTMLAILLARHFRDQGKRVALLSSNSLLNMYLKNETGPGVETVTYQEMAGRYGINLLIPPQEFEGRRDDWVQYEAPERMKRSILKQDSRYDVVICDEAQDVQPFWWEAIECLLADAGSSFYLFFDRSQGVFGSAGQHFVPEDVLPIPSPYFPLVHNYRTTREIAGFSRQFRTGSNVLQSHCGRLGYIPEIIYYKDAADAKAKLERLVKRLTQVEGLEPSEVTMLSARNPAARESILHDASSVAKIPMHRLHQKSKGDWVGSVVPKGSLGLSTIAAFKGMETPVGILVNISEYNLPVENPIMASMIYVACTRAKHMLFIMLHENDAKRPAFEKALATIDRTGVMILEGSQADFEFSGIVSHYNPQRLGWLNVDDPGFEQGRVMFFPHDVAKAEIENIEVGMRIKFRPRIEGGMTIAADLGLVDEMRPPSQPPNREVLRAKS